MLVLSLFIPSIFQILPATMDSGWELVNRRNNIIIYAKKINDSNLLAVRAVSVIDADVPRIAALLKDIDAQQQWRTLAGKSVLVEKENEYHLIFMNELRLGWFLENRYFFLEAFVNTVVDEGKAIISLKAVDRNFPEFESIKGIRLNKINAHITLQYISENKTGISYEFIADPGGNLPPFLINLFNREYLYHDMLNLKKISQDPKYQMAARYSLEARMISDLTRDSEIVKKVIRSKLVEYSGNRKNMEILIENPKFIDVIFKYRKELGEIAYLGNKDMESSIKLAKQVIYFFLKEYRISEMDIFKIQNDSDLDKLLRNDINGQVITENEIETIMLKYYNPSSPAWLHLKNDLAKAYKQDQ